MLLHQKIENNRKLICETLGFDFNNRAGRNKIMNCTACNKKLLKTNKYCTSCGTERINLDESEELFDNGDSITILRPKIEMIKT